jgi:DNA primase catalytic subunit
MTGYSFPKGMRPSTLDERARFYARELNMPKLERWLEKRNGKTVFAVIIGRHTKIYPKQYEKDAVTTIIIDEYDDLESVRSQIIDFLPESVYYDRNVYDEKERIAGQELAFDIDPENITCPVHGSLADKMERKQGLSFCKLELRMARKETLRLYKHLNETFSLMKIVYSGRGYHIHVFDKDAYQMSQKERESLAEALKVKRFPIDAWVTSGEMRLIRLPYSLNGLVSRIVTPLTVKDLESFDPLTDRRCLPRFLKTKS